MQPEPVEGIVAAATTTPPPRVLRPILGGVGPDLLRGDPGRDILDGADGNDRYLAGSARTRWAADQETIAWKHIVADIADATCDATCEATFGVPSDSLGDALRGSCCSFVETD